MVKDPQTKGQVRRIVEEEENVNYERRLVQNLGQESLETAPCLIVMFERVWCPSFSPTEWPSDFNLLCLSLPVLDV